MNTSVWNAQSVTHLTITDCSQCGVRYGLPKEMAGQRQSDGGIFYCPNGHSQVFRASTEAALKRQLETARADTAFWRAQYAAEQNSLRTTKGHLTRLKNRAAAGVCVECHRTFANVARHMQAQHGAHNEGMVGSTPAGDV